jgi:2-amino-4-hydroxy-6-hydroxymethyldihydropteridine diphosphokinase
MDLRGIAWVPRVPHRIESMPCAYIALGSNLPSHAGSPAETLRRAQLSLSSLGNVLNTSSLYLTEPVGNTDQPPFLNAVVALETNLGPGELLTQLLEIEKHFGRNRAAMAPKSARTLDLDLLLYDSEVIQTADLRLPHPELAERRFVLAPLAEIAPGLVHPVTGKTVAALLAELPQAGPNGVNAVKRIAD